MNKEQKVTSLPLSKKIYELAKKKGIELESEYCWVVDNETKKHRVIEYQRYMEKLNCKRYSYYPTLDTSELGEMLPPRVESNYIETTRCSDKGGYNCLVGYLDSVEKAISFNEKTMAEAMGKMYFYLLDNNLL